MHLGGSGGERSHGATSQRVQRCLVVPFQVRPKNLNFEFPPNKGRDPILSSHFK